MDEETFDIANSYDAQHFYRWLYKAAEKHFENPDVQKRFKEWQKNQNHKE